MTDRIRAFDWRTTPLGALDAWPDRLVAAVEAMLVTPQLASLTVGVDRIFLYNDAAAGLYGARHPAVLGLPLSKAFPHEFHRVAAFYDRAFAGEGVHVPSQRLDPADVGAPDVFDAWLAPVRSADGDVLGVQMTGTVARLQEAAIARIAESEDRYRVLLNSIEQGFCVVEMIRDATGAPIDFRFLEANATFERQTGLCDVFGRTMRALAPEHEDRWFERFGEIAATGRPERFEQQSAVLGRWFDVYAFRTGDPTKQRVAILFDDISDRKEQEAALARNRQLFQALATAGNQSTYRMSADWRTMYALDSDTLAVTAEPIVDWIDKYIPPDDRSDVFAAIDVAIRARSLFAMEHRVLCADGGIGWVLSRAVPMLDDDERK